MCILGFGQGELQSHSAGVFRPTESSAVLDSTCTFSFSILSGNLKTQKNMHHEPGKWKSPCNLLMADMADPQHILHLSTLSYSVFLETVSERW